MSILGNLFDKILHRHEAAPAGNTTTTASAQAPGKPASPQATTPAQGTAPASGGSTATATPERVDIEKVLNDMAAKNPQKLNWRASIVDLMKLVGMDSSLQERKQLADELGYTGDKNDSAAMNIWLHKQVMKKLEENGGKVPADLKD